MAAAGGISHVGELMAPLLSHRPHLDGHLLVPLARRQVEHVLDGLRHLLITKQRTSSDGQRAQALGQTLQTKATTGACLMLPRLNTLDGLYTSPPKKLTSTKN